MCRERLAIVMIDVRVVIGDGESVDLKIDTTTFFGERGSWEAYSLHLKRGGLEA
jgi:hypothetical protein